MLRYSNAGCTNPLGARSVTAGMRNIKRLINNSYGPAYAALMVNGRPPSGRDVNWVIDMVRKQFCIGTLEYNAYFQPTDPMTPARPCPAVYQPAGWQAFLLLGAPGTRLHGYDHVEACFNVQPGETSTRHKCFYFVSSLLFLYTYINQPR